MKSFYKYILVFAVLILLFVVPLIWIFRVELLALLNTLRQKAEVLGKINPVFLIAALGILPAVGVPASIFYIVGSIAYGVVLGLVFSGIGVAINISLCYWIANSFLRKWILLFLHKRGHKLLTIAPSEARATIIAVRLMPGVPLSAQNYVLGVAGINFKQYFIYSWPSQMVWAVFFVLVANSAIHQTAESIILVAFGLLAIGLFIKVFRSISGKKKSK